MKKTELKKYLSRNDIAIEGNTAKWNIHLVGEIAGLYTGTFVFKCFLTPTARLACGRLYRELLGPNPNLAFINEDNLAFSLSQLRYRIVESPPFWNSAIGINGLPGDVVDQNVIDAVLEAAVASEHKYMAQIQQRKDDAIKNAKKAAEALLNTKDKTEKLEDSED